MSRDRYSISVNARGSLRFERQNLSLVNDSESIKPFLTTVPFDADHPGGDLIIVTVMFSQITGKACVKHDVPSNLQKRKCQSCVGFRRGGYANGIYTVGNITGVPQLLYQPIVNVFDGGPPTVIRLKVLDGVPPTSLTNATWEIIAEDLAFLGNDKLEAMEVDGVITLRGKDAAKVYFISYYANEVEDPSTWSYPVPILSNV
ncbi:hypothetical protein PT974_04761 [Cladobotryum mycophilum]|uniref:Uncharacterized protein n=1 Tax=Cladobotryum mycophilum TaxID=491253 RepID=A0ABR0SQA7_9HYPO